MATSFVRCRRMVSWSFALPLLDRLHLDRPASAFQQLATVANLQETGQVTVFFKIGSAELDQFQQQRLVTFLDYLSRDSRGRTVILVAIGSASAVGNAEVNKKLSLERADAALPIIQQYLVNTPHEIYKVAGVGDMFAPKDATTKVDQRYQSVRVIAVYNTSELPTVSGS